MADQDLDKMVKLAALTHVIVEQSQGLPSERFAVGRETLRAICGKAGYTFNWEDDVRSFWNETRYTPGNPDILIEQIAHKSSADIVTLSYLHPAQFDKALINPDGTVVVSELRDPDVEMTSDVMTESQRAYADQVFQRFNRTVANSGNMMPAVADTVYKGFMNNKLAVTPREIHQMDVAFEQVNTAGKHGLEVTRTLYERDHGLDRNTGLER